MVNTKICPWVISYRYCLAWLFVLMTLGVGGCSFGVSTANKSDTSKVHTEAGNTETRSTKAGKTKARNAEVGKTEVGKEEWQKVNEPDSMTSSPQPILRLNTGGHTAMVNDLIFYNHGERLISGSDDKTIRIWNVSNPQSPLLINIIRGEIAGGVIGQISALALSPDEKLLAVGGHLDNKSGGDIRLHDLETGNVVAILKGHEDAILDLAFSKDGRFLASGSLDKTVIIWKRDNDIWRLFQRLEGHKDCIYTVAFSKDRFASGSDDNTVRLYAQDFKDQNFKLTKVLEGHEDDVSSICFSPDGRYLITAASDKKILLWDKDGNFIKTFAKQDVAPIGLSLSENGGLLLTGAYGSPDICYLYSFPDGEVKVKFEGHKNSVFATAISPHLLIATCGGNNNEIILWNPQGKIKGRIEGVGNSVWTCGINKMRIGFGSTKKAGDNNDSGPIEQLFDLNAFNLTKGDGKTKGDVNLLRAKTDDGLRKLTVECGGPNYYPWILRVEEHGKMRAKIIREETSGYRHNCFSLLGNNRIVSGGVNGKLFVYNLDGDTIAELVGHTDEIWALAATEDGNWLVSGGSDQVMHLWFLGGLERSDRPDAPLDNSPDSSIDWQILKEKSPITYERWYKDRDELSFLKSADPLMYRAWKNLLESFYLPIQKITPVCSLFFTQGGDWIIWTPDGYFTASSPSAMQYIGYHLNQGFANQSAWVPFSQLYDCYFRPDLVRSKLAKPTVDLSQYTDLARVEEALIKAPPPRVSILSPVRGEAITSEWIELKVQVEDTGGKIGDIRVYRNGKLVASEGGYRVAEASKHLEEISPVEEITPVKEITQAQAYNNSNLTSMDTALRRVWLQSKEPEQHLSEADQHPSLESTSLSGRVEKIYRILLVAGENEISVQAMNGQNTVLSGMATVKVVAQIPKRPDRLFMLAVGIQNFRDKSLNLNYSHVDAQSMIDLISTKAKGAYKEVIVNNLIDPTKAEINSAFIEFKKRMGPEDSFIFYAATHGSATGEKYYLITSEYAGTPNNNVTLTSQDLMKLSKDLPAQRQVLILDTCQAGAMDTTFLDLYETRLTTFAMGTGMHVLSAAASYQDAKEGYHGHGLFTYYVLSGLQGEADTNRDKKVTVVEMGSYLKEQVNKASGGSQKPVIMHFGEDMVMDGL